MGSGKGQFLRHSAAAQPEVNFLGVEVAQKYAAFAAAGLAKEGLRNAIVVNGDAVRLFAEWLPDDSLAAVHVYFPDPWWKARHKKRRRHARVVGARRATHVAARRRLHFWTDVEEYFQTTLELLAAKTSLLGPLDVPETPAEHDMAYRTHFEHRVRLANESVYRAEFRKE